MRILAIVVTYYPERYLLQKNIDAFIKDVDNVLIWENTPEPEKKEYRFVQHPKVIYHGDGINSISRALNFGWHYADKHGFDYILTMDQDSQWVNFDLFLSTVRSGVVPFGLWGPSTNGEIDSSYKNVPSLITSGMLVNVSILKKIGGYDERFVVEGVDSDLCYRAKTFGISSYIVRNGMLLQRFGTPKEITWLFHKIPISGYSALRRFNTAKSKAMLLRKYKYNYMSILKLLYVELILKEIFILLGDDNKWKKIISQYKGFLSGLTTKDLGYTNKTVKVI